MGEPGPRKKKKKEPKKRERRIEDDVHVHKENKLYVNLNGVNVGRHCYVVQRRRVCERKLGKINWLFFFVFMLINM